jgi:hypothetical protein
MYYCIPPDIWKIVLTYTDLEATFLLSQCSKTLLQLSKESQVWVRLYKQNFYTDLFKIGWTFPYNQNSPPDQLFKKSYLKWLSRRKEWLKSINANNSQIELAVTKLERERVRLCEKIKKKNGQNIKQNLHFYKRLKSSLDEMVKLTKQNLTSMSYYENFVEYTDHVFTSAAKNMKNWERFSTKPNARTAKMNWGAKFIAESRFNRGIDMVKCMTVQERGELAILQARNSRCDKCENLVTKAENKRKNVEF